VVAHSRAVGDERLRGQRTVGPQGSGSYAASASKILAFAAAEVHAFFTDVSKRARWLDVPVSIRTASASKSVRMQWPAATNVDVWITEKGETKCSVAVQHGKLAESSAIPELKSFWRAALQRLAETLTASSHHAPRYTVLPRNGPRIIHASTGG
jgi:hypothetical protein